MKPIVVSIAKKAGYIFAVLVIMAAMLVVVSRILTPYLDARRGKIEAWASELLQKPTTIEKASVSWFQYQPGVALSNVTLLDKNTKDPLLQVRTVKIFFSIPQSIWQRKLVPSGMLVSGVDMVIHQSASGEFVLQGFPAIGGDEKEPFKNESKIKDIFVWLSAEPLIILRDIDVRYTGITGQKRFVTLYNLRLENTDTVHSLIGKAILHQDISTELTLAARWDGQEPDLQKINGKIYVNVSGMSLAQWFQGLAWNGWEIKKGLVSAKIWAVWRDGGFKRVQGSLQMFNVGLYSGTDQSLRNINRLSGDVGWKKEGNDQIIAGDDILIDWSSRLWPVTSFYVKLSPDADSHLAPVIMNLGYLDIVDSRSLLASSPKILPEEMMKAVTDLKLTGNLENISITFGGPSADLMPSMMQGHFSHVGFQSVGNLPAAENLTGAFVWKGAGGSLSLESRQSVITYSSIFDKPIMLDQLMGDMLWQHDESGEWKFVFKSIGALNQDLALNLNGHVLLPASLAPTVNISANFTLQNVAHVSRYLPTKILSKELSSWLRDAFITGEAQSGSLILRGAMSDFPFDHNNGSFIATAVVSHVQLHYAPDWPDLKNIIGKVQFSGRQLIIDLDNMQITGIDIGRVHGEIPSLSDEKSPILTVYSTPIHTDFSRGMSFLHHSPLEKTIGKMFRNVELTGPIELLLSLTIPLDNTDDTEVKGNIDITNGVMQLVPWKLNISKLNGKVNFTERSTDAVALQGELFGKPLRIDLGSLDKGNSQSVVQATISNRMDLKDIELWLKIPFSEIAKGETSVMTKVDLAVDKPIMVHIESNLTGVALDLPAQYAKKADDIRQFSADIAVLEKKPLKLKFNYADLLNVALILDRDKDSFNLIAADLRLGKGDPEWPQGKGLYITGALASLNSDEIKSYLNMSTSGGSSKLQLRVIDIVVDELNLYGIKLTQARLQLVPSNNTWIMTVTSPEIAGKITVPTNFVAAATLIVDLQRINLNALSRGAGGTLDIVAKSLPSIKFSADSVTYGEASFGDVGFMTSPSANGMVISSFTIHSPDINLQAAGDWIQSKNGNATRLHGKASSRNVSNLLNRLGFDAHNFVSSNGNVDFDLNWGNAPYALSLSNMNGAASLDMSKGRIVEVSQTSDAKMDLGRMLNLFSLQNIPRRLSLDFSDVFLKGYSFDTLRGDFKFSQGNAITNNMRFDGTLARVEIHGTIGLATKNFDLVLSVTPYVTSSIPLAATLITGQPVIGVAAWAVNKMIGGEVSKVATYSYTVTGSWVNPVWNVINKSNGGVKKINR